MKSAMENTLKQDEIPLFENMDTLSVQFAFIFGCYMLTYAILYGLGELLPGMKSIIYGFNFLIGVVVTTGIKKLIHALEERKILKKHYVNDFLMVRLRNVFYDVMVVAGVSAIRVSTMESYIGVLCAVCLSGMVVTFAYNRFVAQTLFRDYAEEQFVAMYGMLTGTASSGLVLLRELDGEFKTPVSDNLIYQNIPAIFFGLPLMLIAAAAPKDPVGTLLIAIGFFICLNLLLFRAQILGLLKRKTK